MSIIMTQKYYLGYVRHFKCGLGLLCFTHKVINCEANNFSNIALPKRDLLCLMSV